MPQVTGTPSHAFGVRRQLASEARTLTPLDASTWTTWTLTDATTAPTGARLRTQASSAFGELPESVRQVLDTTCSVTALWVSDPAGAGLASPDLTVACGQALNLYVFVLSAH